MAKLEAELISAGCLSDKLRLIVITQGDLDHTKNCGKLQDKHEATVEPCTKRMPLWLGRHILKA